MHPARILLSTTEKKKNENVNFRIYFTIEAGKVSLLKRVCGLIKGHTHTRRFFFFFFLVTKTLSPIRLPTFSFTTQHFLFPPLRRVCVHVDTRRIHLLSFSASFVPAVAHPLSLHPSPSLPPICLRTFVLGVAQRNSLIPFVCSLSQPVFGYFQPHCRM